MSGYLEHQRGAESSYERYLAGMDASMRQKVALTAAYLLSQGRIADMGMGSGSGSYGLAALYPRLEVVGIDVSETMVELARRKYQLPNLSFAVGDIARPVVASESLDGILNSSVLHHVTTFGGYRHENAAEALRAQVGELRQHGVLVVRDFLAPEDGDVWLDLPTGDGDASDDPRTCSTAALFERFAREFRSLSPAPGFPFERGPVPRPGWRRYRVAQKHATEFLLRKDYRQDWESEVKEEYTYFTQERFEQVFAELGLRVLASTPLHNPWIVRNRFRGQTALSDADGRELPFPPTNYVIAGEKAPSGEGVRFREAGLVAPLGYLRLEYHRNRETGFVFDLAWRPNRTLDVLPWFERGGATFVLVRASYPRPVLCVAERGLDGSRAPHYVTEPLNVLQTDRPVGQTVEAMLAVEVEPVFVQEPLLNRSGFSTSGHIRAIEVQQLLRAAQVGALPDARLELNAYELLLQRGRDAGPWIGEEIRIEDACSPPGVASMQELMSRRKRRVYESVASEASSGFLEMRSASFEELDAGSNIVVAQKIEFVRPAHFSSRTIAVALLARCGSEALLAVHRDDLPAAQAFSGNSDLLIAPAWRLPRELRDWIEAGAWLRERLRVQHGIRGGEIFDLGGPYRPSPGLSPELVHPVAIPIKEIAGEASEPLEWVPLTDCVRFRAALVDGHLRVLVLRTAHALGWLRYSG